MKYEAVSCTPCDRTLWEMLKALESGWESPYGTTKDHRMFEHLRGYEKLEDVPCCSIARG